MTRADLVWLLAVPIYLVVGTVRHEAAHALVAMAQGATITEFVALPTTLDGTFYWGYVRWQGGNVTWLTTAAPYLLDLITVAVGLAAVLLFAMPRWVWINVVIVLIASPLGDSAYQYGRTLLAGGGDVGELLTELPDMVVHAWFLAMIPIYAIATLIALRRGPRTQTSNEGLR